MDYMAGNTLKERNITTDLNRLTPKSKYKAMIDQMTAFLTLRGIASLTGINYQTLRRIRDPHRYTYCRIRNAVIIRDLYHEMVQLTKAMKSHRVQVAKFE
jgi:hypothetical protein